MRQHFIESKYTVIFHDYTERHFIKDFSKKYKTHWNATRESIIDSLERIYNLSGASCLDFICNSNSNTCLIKYDFRVAKTNASAKTSGNRCILEVCNKKLEVRVLLVYCKEHIDRAQNQETLWWKEHLQNEFNLCCG